jgi:hypothetical protein
MRPFSELQPGDLFLWQSGTWRKVYPVAHTELRYAPPYNAVKVDKEPPVEGVIVPPTYRTFAGWLVMVEPSDVAEVTP